MEKMNVKIIKAGGQWGSDDDVICECDLPVLLEPGAAFIWKDKGSPVRYKVSMRGLVIDNNNPVYLLYVIST